MDLTRELRLRRWARENYAPPEERDGSWHPVVLEEMQLRDAELGERAARYAGSPYVPLLPTGTHRLHGSHAPAAGPKLVSPGCDLSSYIPG